MKKVKNLIGILLSICFVYIMTIIPFSTLQQFPNSMKLTVDDINNINIKNLTTSVSLENKAVDVISTNKDNTKGKLIFKLFNFFPLKSINIDIVPARKVFLGGFPIGMNLNMDGVLVVSLGTVNTTAGKASCSSKDTIQPGDIIKELNEKQVLKADDIGEILKTVKANNKIPIKLLRNNSSISTTITPLIEEYTNLYKLGLWVKDSVAGVGTVSYIKFDGRYGSLGHPISDSETGTIIPCYDGSVHNCKIIGINKGTRGKPGELKGIYYDSDIIGTIDKNNKFGLFGIFTDSFNGNDVYDVGSRLTASVGKAKIYTTIGDKAEFYDIEIIKAISQNIPNDKSMIVRVTDKRLLQNTGGIVQGMSGSPIIQNGKLIGAITHVFVNDPTKGYGIYLDWMYEN